MRLFYSPSPQTIALATFFQFSKLSPFNIRDYGAQDKQQLDDGTERKTGGGDERSDLESGFQCLGKS
jgi:hypothetical protein